MKEEDKQLKQIKRILVPIDGSKCSLKAARYAIKIAKIQRSKVYCVHAIVKVPYGNFLDGYAAQMYFEGARERAMSWFSDVVKIARQGEASDNNDSGIEVLTDIFTSVNSIVEALVNYSREKDIDLIVIGTRGNSRIKRLLIGSIAMGVVRYAGCPVLLVR
jgi:nucleotide-binding universal stress UspA family protein